MTNGNAGLIEGVIRKTLKLGEMFEQFKNASVEDTSSVGEIKKPKGIISKEQKEFLIEANKRNYYAVVCFGFDECLQTIEKYFKNEL